MKTFYKAAGALLAAATAVMVVAKADIGTPNAASSLAKSERGRYVVRIAGCNDCHTPGYLQMEGAVPESEWLTGDSLGWRGPWGTKYSLMSPPTWNPAPRTSF